MIALPVEHIREFMNKLLLTPSFDCFMVSEASITTFATFSIDGLYHPEFFEDEQIGLPDPAAETQIGWDRIRPFCLSVIKGKRLPLSFHFVLQLPRKELPAFLEKNDLSLAAEDVFGLFLNVQYRSEALTVTTGSSLRVFTGDRSLDQAWDQTVRSFLEKEGLI